MNLKLSNKKLPSYYDINSKIIIAQQNNQPIVALESAVITHGLPYPQNIELALKMEDEVLANNSTPATIAVLDGKIKIGLTKDEIHRLATEKNAKKISRRDFAPAIVKCQTGGTTVSATMLAAHHAGIMVFATGGIGGVHRDNIYDISPDLPELSRTPLIVVCAGAKAILDLPATNEYLETYGIPICGYQCDELPAFYSANSGIPIHVRVETEHEIIQIAKTHWALGFTSGILVVQPPPSSLALDFGFVDDKIKEALLSAKKEKISGQAVTPYLLQKMSELTKGKSISTNVSLLVNNAGLAARIASTYHQSNALRV